MTFLVLHGRPTTVLLVGGADQREVHHRVDVQIGEEAAERVAVEADPFDPVQQVGELGARVRGVHPDDPFDPRIGGQSGRHVGAQVAAHPGDDDDPRST